MAQPETISRLTNALARLKAVDIEKVTRPGLGSLALAPEFADGLSRLKDEATLATGVSKEAPESSARVYADNLDALNNTLEQLSKASDADFVASRSSYLQQVNSYIEGTRGAFPAFVSVALARSGILQNPEQMLTRVSESVKEAQKELESVRAATQKAVSEAQTLAKSIEEKARLTASGISVKAAQEQFQKAQGALRWKAILWGVGSAFLFVLFVWYAMHFVHLPGPVQQAQQNAAQFGKVQPNNGQSVAAPSAATSSGWEVLYFAIVRITILTALGALATFSLKVFRAHMYMHELNLHRQRVANSIEGFIQAAQTPEQRDIILGRLVDSVVSFGSSGLNDKDADSVSVSNLTIEAIMKNLPKAGGG